MVKKQYRENLFSKLTRKDGSSFSDETVRNWYQARHYILCLNPPLDGNGISPSSVKRVHAVIYGISDIMLAAARQIALIAHYPNFNEETGANRTKITILCENASTQNDFDKIINRLSAEKYLCNLPMICKYSFRKNAESEPFHIKNEDSFIDIEIELVGCNDFSEYTVPDNAAVISEANIRNACDNVPKETLETIDTSKARLVKMAYEIGCELDNLPADDPNTARRYVIALNVFRYHMRKDSAEANWRKISVKKIIRPLNSIQSHIRKRERCSKLSVKDKLVNAYSILNRLYKKSAKNGSWEKDSVTNKLSNVFCSDCFESRLRSTGKYVPSAKATAEMAKAVEDNLWALAKCEHSRWNVEKLILGFRPLSPKEVFEDNTLFGNDKKTFRKNLKKRSQDPAHIDLCSYRDLRRIDPSSMKYDCFLILSMPQIQSQTF